MSSLSSRPGREPVAPGELEAYMRRGEASEHLRDPLTEEPLRAPVHISDQRPAMSSLTLNRWFATRGGPACDPYTRLPVNPAQLHVDRALDGEMNRLRLRAQLSWRAQGDVERALATLWLRRFCQRQAARPFQVLPSQSCRQTLSAELHAQAQALGLRIVEADGQLAVTGLGVHGRRKIAGYLVVMGACFTLGAGGVLFYLQRNQTSPEPPVTFFASELSGEIFKVLQRCFILCAAVAWLERRLDTTAGWFGHSGHRSLPAIGADAFATLSVGVALCLLASDRFGPTPSAVGVTAGFITQLAALRSATLAAAERHLREQVDTYSRHRAFP